jgi:glycosyltransferase involved in cell wall biosynthesis
VVLPSYYREGVPRSLLEAASMGKPVITTDSVGCRDTVEDGVTGWLVRPRDVEDLATRLMAMIDMPSTAAQSMSRAARKRVMTEFDERHVIARYADQLRLAAPNAIESVRG